MAAGLLIPKSGEVGTSAGEPAGVPGQGDRTPSREALYGALEGSSLTPQLLHDLGKRLRVHPVLQEAHQDRQGLLVEPRVQYLGDLVRDYPGAPVPAAPPPPMLAPDPP